MKRSDVHRPSKLDPNEYRFVAHECVKIEGIGDCYFIQAEREALRAHMSRTGGTYSRHEHGGNCMVCGNANAVYTILFHHAPTNTYVRMGADCADKCEAGDLGQDAFRAKCLGARLRQKGNAKAVATLADAGMSKAWDLFTTWRDGWKGCECSVPICRCYADWQRALGWRDEEHKVFDVVGKLVKYGSVSDKTMTFLKTLLERIEKRAELDAQRAAERALASPCPVGRVAIEGEVLSKKVVDTDFGSTIKMLVRATGGYKVWCSMPSGLSADRGDTVAFSAKLTPSRDDEKFGFGSRPTKATLVKKAEVKA